MNRIIKAKNAALRCAAAMLLIALIIPVSAPVTAHAAENPLKLSVEQVLCCPSPGDCCECGFSYCLTAIEAGNPMPGGRRITGGYIFDITGTDIEEVGPLTFTQQGAYHYELSQLYDGERTCCDYDTQVYDIEVIVGEELSTDMIITNQDGFKAARLLFEPMHLDMSYLPLLVVDPPVKKVVTGSPGADSVFTFILAAADPANPMPDGKTGGSKILQIKGSGEKDFGEWAYTAPGVYVYKIYEVNDGINGYTYDTTVYTITDTVRDEYGQLTYSREITDDARRQVTDIVFTNKYTDPDKPGNSNRPGNTGNTDNSGNLSSSDNTGKTGISGTTGPKTGDDIETALYHALFMSGAVLAAGAIIYLIAGKKRKKPGDCYEER